MRISILYLCALLIAGSAAAASFDPPKRKSGLWEVKMMNDKMPLQVLHYCVDQKTDSMTKEDMRGLEKSCSKNEMRKEGASIVSESVCKMGGSTVTSRGVLSGNFDSAYRMEVKSTYEPPLHGTKESLVRVEGKWLGPCKPGQKPGDITLESMPGMEEMMKKKR
jgi:hypothetical protein